MAAHKICVAAALEKFEDLGIVNFLTREMGGEFERMDLISRTKAANIVSSTLFDVQTSDTTSASKDANSGLALKIPLSRIQGTSSGNSTARTDREIDEESANDNDSLNSSAWSGDLLDASDSFADSEANTMATMMARASANGKAGNGNGVGVLKIESLTPLPSPLSAGQENQPVDLAVKVVPLSTTSSRRCALVDVFAEVMALRILSESSSISKKNGSFISNRSGILNDEEEHPSPVAVEMIEYGVTPEGYCIVMERCARSLRDWRAMIPESVVDADLGGHLQRCLALFQDIVSKVTILHSMGITHYDLKCDNILVAGDSFSETPMTAESVKLLPRLRLADFGESYVTPGYHADSTRSKWDRGTECIKSPEMLTISVITDADHPNHDRRKNAGTSSASDIWSLGCLLYELIVGEYLFQGEDWTRFYCRLTGRGQQLISDKARAALLKFGSGGRQVLEFLQNTMLVRDPRRRPAAAQLFHRMEKAGLIYAVAHVDNEKLDPGVVNRVLPLWTREEKRAPTNMSAMVDLILNRTRMSRRYGLLTLDRFVSFISMDKNADGCECEMAPWNTLVWRFRDLWDQIIFCGQGDIAERFKVLFLGKKVITVGSVASCNSTVDGMLARRKLDEVEIVAGKDLLVYDGSEQGYRLLVAIALQWLQIGRGMSPLAAVNTLEDKIM
eukprot:g2896.t1